MVYSFENGEKLTGIAFLDINFFVTSMRSIKRFLLVGDVHRSICLIGFQVRSPVSKVFATWIGGTRKTDCVG